MPAKPPPDIFKAYDIRGIYGEQIDGDVAERIGRAFARVLSRLSGKPISALRVGLGRDMRLSAPELSARYRDGLLGAGANVLDAGQVGSEMLYFLVGSRELDGGLMCTASHNPRAYTGAKLVREGAIALSGDAGIQDVRRELEAEIDAGPAEKAPRAEDAARGTLEEVDIYEEFGAAVLRFIDPEVIRASGARRLKVVVDGGNGMAGPMVGPLLEQLDLELIESYWTPDGNFPDHEPNPLLPENRQLIIERVAIQRSGPRHSVGRRRRPLLLHRRHRRVRGRRLPDRAAGRVAAAEGAALRARRSSTTCAPRGRCPTRCARRAASPTSTGWAMRSSRRACARRARCSEERSPGTTTSVTSTARTPARSRRCWSSSCSRARARACPSCSRPSTSATSSPGRSTRRSSDPAAKMEEIAARFADARQDRLDGISIDYEDWHFNVRPSNTEPLLRLCLESLVSREDMERRRDEVLALIRS